MLKGKDILTTTEATAAIKPNYKIKTRIGLLIALLPAVIGTVGYILQKNSGLDKNNVPAISTPQVASEWGWMPNSPLKIWGMCGIPSSCKPGDDVRLPPLDLTAHLEGWLFEGPASGTIKTRFPMPQKP